MRITDQIRITELLRLDVYRDGGSVSVSFQGDDGKQYCLFFGIRSESFHEKVKRYRQPVLKISTPSEYTSPVTGVSSADWRRESHEVAWGEADTFLQTLRPLSQDFQSNYSWVFAEMLRAVACEGGREHSGSCENPLE
ncbi:MAG: hypothetical protein M3P06_19620 [Acidobacteriota bacterium]|nr:hypothetical protein [Acidobacteriota bacterium]